MQSTPNPVAITIFGLDIRWYAICICTGMILAVLIGLRRAPRHGIKPDDLLDVLLVCLPSAIIGLRVWYVAFNWENYHSFYEIINYRAGGLAIHGGLLFGFGAAYLMLRRKKIDFLQGFDLAAPCVALGQAIGRWGNYFNQEAHGTATDLPWAITIEGVKVHPTFLYESLWCLALFFLLSYVDGRRKFVGQTLSLYMILYSVERFLVEQLRTDSLLAGPSEQVLALQQSGFDPTGIEGVAHIGNFLIFPFRTAQMVSLLAIIAGAVLYAALRKRRSLENEAVAAAPEHDGTEMGIAPEQSENGADAATEQNTEN